MRNQEEKKIIFRNIEDALTDLNAEDKGRYFICSCPECNEQEAFIYKNNMSFIQCNRENECGERMFLHFEEEKKIEYFERSQDGYPVLTKKQSESLSLITRYIGHMQYNVVSPTLDDGYRGLSRETTTPFIADFNHPLLVKRMFEYGSELFPKKYAESDWMCKRNLVFPIYGENGMVDRILLRSSIDPKIEPKEIQLIVNPSKETRDFFIDIPKDAETVVIGEAILDAASFRELEPSIGLLSLTGSKKTRKLCEYLLENQNYFRDKEMILALDNDNAGWKATQEIMNTLDDLKIKNKVFPYLAGMHDPNEFLNEDRIGFKAAFKRVKTAFKDNPKILTNSFGKNMNLEVER